MGRGRIFGEPGPKINTLAPRRRDDEGRRGVNEKLSGLPASFFACVWEFVMG